MAETLAQGLHANFGEFLVRHLLVAASNAEAKARKNKDTTGETERINSMLPKYPSLP